MAKSPDRASDVRDAQQTVVERDEKPPAEAETNDEESLAIRDGRYVAPTIFEIPWGAEPPGGEWLETDDGRRYYLVEVPKQEPWYSPSDDGKVSLPPGVQVDLEEENDDTLVVRIYDPESLTPPAGEGPPGPVERPSFDDLESLEVDEVDRLRFESFSEGLPSEGQWRQGFALADMNGDGHRDIVHGPPRKGDGVPKIFLGDGEGDWRLWREVSFRSEPLDYGDVDVADFDGDGFLDLALAVHLRGVVVLRGDGQGHFEQWGDELPYRVSGGGREVPEYSSRTLTAVDWNGDGRQDLLTVAEGPRLNRSPGANAPEVNRGHRGAVLFLNLGDGRWERYDQGTGRAALFGDGIAVGDFDGDGVLDFAIASRVRGARNFVKLGREDGSWVDSVVGPARNGIYTAVTATDLDGDGRDELVGGYAARGGDAWWSGVDIYRLRDDGTWTRQPVAAREGSSEGITAIAAGDLDGDGRDDLVALTGDGERWTLLAGEDGDFDREVAPELDRSDLRGCQGFHAALTDVDGDGRQDLLMGFAGEPGSEIILEAMGAEGLKRCGSGGSVEVWRNLEPPMEETEEATASSQR